MCRYSRGMSWIECLVVMLNVLVVNTGMLWSMIVREDGCVAAESFECHCCCGLTEEMKRFS